PAQPGSHQAADRALAGTGRAVDGEDRAGRILGRVVVCHRGIVAGARQNPVQPLEWRGKTRLEWAAGASGAFFDPPHSINQPLPRFHHEGPVLPEVGEESSPRLQGGPPLRQDLRDLQDQPALQGPPALSSRRASEKGRGNAAFFVGDAPTGPRGSTIGRPPTRTLPCASRSSPCSPCPGPPASPWPRVRPATPC